MKKLVRLLLYSFIHLFSASTANAQVSLENTFMLNETDTVASTFPTISTLISSLLPNALVLAGIILFLIGFGAGFTLITSGDNPEKTEKGKQALMGAIIGFAIIFASYWIIQIIQILTGVKILQPTI